MSKLDKRVYCFDRDGTVDTSSGPVPLSLLKGLSVFHDVWAIGNQKLREEANIPGIAEAKKVKRSLWGNQLVDANLHEDTNHAGMPARKERLELIESLYEEDVHFVHIDDVDVGAGGWDRWSYYTPDQFADLCKS